MDGTAGPGIEPVRCGEGVIMWWGGAIIMRGGGIMRGGAILDGTAAGEGVNPRSPMETMVNRIGKRNKRMALTSSGDNQR
jgi:hypothetical protein